MGSSSFTEAFLKSGSLHPSPFPDRASMEQGFHADEFAGGGAGGSTHPVCSQLTAWTNASARSGGRAGMGRQPKKSSPFQNGERLPEKALQHGTGGRIKQ